MMFKTKYRYLYIFLLGAYSFLNIKFTEGDALFDFEVNDLFLGFFVFAFVFLLWEGNRLVNKSIDGFHFGKGSYRPLIVHFLLSIILVSLLSFIGNLFIPLMIDAPDKSTAWRLMLGFNFRINLFLHSINAIVFYKNLASHNQVEAERLKKESAEAQFDALRNQVNPHFLFNSFNVLSTLVYQDQEAAAKFIDRLSQVYRYLLKNKDSRLVKLEDELKFLHAYLFLMKTRFQENLKIDNRIEESSKDRYIVPAALQLLIENAIKHNEVSRQHPLAITIYNQNGHLVVENNIQLKQQKEESSQVGLDNIRKRYAFLSDENPVIVHANGKFTVKIPLIKVEE